MDVLIKNIKTIDNKIKHITIHNQKINQILDIIPNEDDYVKVIDIGGKWYVSPGWMDMHTHCFEKFETYYDNPDAIGYKQGVTTVVDAGTAGVHHIDEFYSKRKEYKTNIYAFLNVSKIGLERQDELSDMGNIDMDRIRLAVDRYPDFIVGIKARLSKTVVGNTNIQGLLMAKEIASELGLPVMAHIGSNPPVLREVLDNLDKGDIVTHIFNGKENGIITHGDIKEEVIKAKQRGVLFDIGHGTDSFNFEVANIALKKGIKADTISSDIYHRNREQGPVYSLVETMNKLLYLGYTLKEVIDMVTVQVCRSLSFKNKGIIKEGYSSDLTFFSVEDISKELMDSNKNIKNTNTQIIPKAVLLNGEWIVL